MCGFLCPFISLVIVRMWDGGGFSFSVADPSNEDGGNGSNVNNFHINSAWIFMCHDGNREEKDVLPP